MPCGRRFGGYRRNGVKRGSHWRCGSARNSGIFSIFIKAMEEHSHLYGAGGNSLYIESTRSRTREKVSVLKRKSCIQTRVPAKPLFGYRQWGTAQYLRTIRLSPELHGLHPVAPTTPRQSPKARTKCPYHQSPITNHQSHHLAGTR
jgi:hypothetical protein